MGDHRLYFNNLGDNLGATSRQRQRSSASRLSLRTVLAPAFSANVPTASGKATRAIATGPSARRN